jgi:hypothetical protein
VELAWITQHWEQLTALGGVIAALMRNNFMTKAHEKRITHLEAQIENIESGLTKELSEVKQALARIEGYLKAKAENE